MNDNIKKPEMLYRYTEIHYAPPMEDWGDCGGEGRTEIYLDTLAVLKATPKGLWVDYYGRKKFVLAHARKRFAHETKTDALESLIARKKAQQRILTKQLKNAKQVEAQATQLLIGESGEIGRRLDMKANR